MAKRPCKPKPKAEFEIVYQSIQGRDMTWFDGVGLMRPLVPEDVPFLSSKPKGE